MKRFFPLASLALCLLMSVCTPALAADYTFEGTAEPGYAEPTSVEYVYTANGPLARQAWEPVFPVRFWRETCLLAELLPEYCPRLLLMCFS